MSGIGFSCGGFGAEGSAEGFYGDSFVADFEDGEGFGAGRRLEEDFVVLGGSHEGSAEGRDPADVVAVEVDLVCADDAHDALCSGGVCVADGGSEEGPGGALPCSGSLGIDDFRGFDSPGQEADSGVDLPETALAVLVVGVFTAIAVAGSSRHHLRHGRAFPGEQKPVLVF